MPDIYSLLGLDLLKRVVKDLKDTYYLHFENHKLDELGVIFTKIPRNTKINNPKMFTNMNAIKTNFDTANFFGTKFFKADKLITSKLKTFIVDREDNNLLQNLKEICKEFEDNIGGNYD